MTPEQKREYHREYNKRWYVANKERRQAQMAEWRDANRDAYEAKQAEYRKTKAAKALRNAAKARWAKTERGLANGREKTARRRAFEMARSAGPIDLLAVLVRHGHKCGVCRKEITGRYEIDHIVALSLGGEHVQENLQPAHPKCNRIKGGYEAHRRERWLF